MGPDGGGWEQMRASAWWRSMANAADCGGGASAAARGYRHATPQAEATATAGAAGSAAAEAATSAEPGRSATAGATAECVWRADVSTFVAGAAGTGGTRQAGAASVAHRAAALGLAGPLGAELAD
eukprot:1441201-Pleurochrysis_carterae.AAC.1